MNESVNDVMDKLNYTEISMLKRNKIFLAMLASSVVVSASAFAEESVSSTATITVQNAFDLVEVTPMSFGTITVATPGLDSGATDGANITLKGDGTSVIDDKTVATTGGSIRSLVEGTPATFEISNAAGFSGMDIILETDPISMKNLGAPEDNGTFTISDFKSYDADGDETSENKIITGEDGTATFIVGAKLALDPKSKKYIDGQYTANYEIKVKY